MSRRADDLGDTDDLGDDLGDYVRGVLSMSGPDLGPGGSSPPWPQSGGGWAVQIDQYGAPVGALIGAGICELVGGPRAPRRRVYADMADADMAGRRWINVFARDVPEVQHHLVWVELK